jgi:hypothetical protein
MEFDLADADSSQYLSINDRFYVDVEYSIKDSCRVYFYFTSDLLFREVDLLAEAYPRQDPQISPVVTPNGQR